MLSKKDLDYIITKFSRYQSLKPVITKARILKRRMK